MVILGLGVLMPVYSKETKARMALKNKISNLDWKSLINYSKDMDSKVSYQILKPFKQSWVMPQLMMWLGKDNGVKLFKNPSNGLYSVELTLRNLIAQAESGALYFEDGTALVKEDLQGIFALLSKPDRSAIIPGKATEVLRYNACVPLFMSAFKEFRNVEYEQWDWGDSWTRFVLDPQFLELSKNFDSVFRFSNAELLELRNQCDQKKILDSAHAISFNFVADKSDSLKSFIEMPRLVKLMLLQMWIFRPEHRTKYGIYHTDNLDTYPENLVGEEQ